MEAVMKNTRIDPRLRENISYFLFLLPTIAFFGAVIVYPMFDSLILSFQHWDGTLHGVRTWAGLENYRTLFFHNPIFLVSLRNNVVYTAMFLFVINFFCLVFAMLLNQPRKGRNVFRAFTYLPNAISGVSVALIWRWIFNMQFGLLNETLNTIGLGALASDWLGDLSFAFSSIIVAGGWQSIGAGIIFFLAGLQTIPLEIYEAARIDGANRVQSFFRITIPLLKETFVIVVTLTIITTMRVYDIVFALTWGGPARRTNVLSTLMYFESFVFGNFTQGAAIAWVLFLVIAVFAIPYVLAMSKNDIY